MHLPILSGITSRKYLHNPLIAVNNFFASDPAKFSYSKQNAKLQINLYKGRLPDCMIAKLKLIIIIKKGGATTPMLDRDRLPRLKNESSVKRLIKTADVLIKSSITRGPRFDNHQPTAIDRDPFNKLQNVHPENQLGWKQ